QRPRRRPLLIGNLLSRCCKRPRRASPRGSSAKAGNTIRRPRRDVRTILLATTRGAAGGNPGPLNHVTIATMGRGRFAGRPLFAGWAAGAWAAKSVRWDLLANRADARRRLDVL